MMHFAVIVHPSGRKRICLRIKYKKNLPRQALDRDETAQQVHSLAFYAWGYRAWWCGRCRRLKFLCRKARPHPSGSRSAGAENTSVWRHFLLKPNVCQDRLGTNIGNTQKKEGGFSQPARHDERRHVGVHRQAHASTPTTTRAETEEAPAEAATPSAVSTRL